MAQRQDFQLQRRTAPEGGGKSGEECREEGADREEKEERQPPIYQPHQNLRERHMRGGSQAHLVEGQDGLFYVAKFTGNPQGTRTLINEWFAHLLFQQLGISTPPLRVLRLTKAVQASSQDLVFQLGKTRLAVEPGLHLGSPCPVHPETTSIYDFL